MLSPGMDGGEASRRFFIFFTPWLCCSYQTGKGEPAKLSSGAAQFLRILCPEQLRKHLKMFLHPSAGVREGISDAVLVISRMEKKIKRVNSRVFLSSNREKPMGTTLVVSMSMSTPKST